MLKIQVPETATMQLLIVDGELVRLIGGKRVFDDKVMSRVEPSPRPALVHGVRSRLFRTKVTRPQLLIYPRLRSVVTGESQKRGIDRPKGSGYRCRLVRLTREAVYVFPSVPARVTCGRGFGRARPEYGLE